MVAVASSTPPASSPRPPAPERIPPAFESTRTSTVAPETAQSVWYAVRDPNLSGLFTEISFVNSGRESEPPSPSL